MFPCLIKNAFVKVTPNTNEYFFCFSSEGMPYLTNVNESGYRILALCDGKHSIEEIIYEVNRNYDEELSRTEEKVKDFLNPLIDAKIILENQNEIVENKIIRGSMEAYMPTIISWDITDYCPLNCKHCYINEKNCSIISKKEIDTVLEMIDDSGIYQVQLTGGEALTHPELEYIISGLINRGIVTAISTSGYFSNNTIFEILEKIKLVKGSILRVSLDGLKSTHNKVRGKNDAYDKTMIFLKEAIKRGIPCQVETCLINQNKNELEEMIRKVKEIGVNSIEIGLLLEMGNAKRNKLHSSWNAKKYQSLLTELNTKFGSDEFRIRQLERKDRKNCGAGYVLCHITSALEVKPCAMLEINLGNLHKESMEKIMIKWGRVFHDLEGPQSKFCQKCEEKEMCNNCSAAGFNTKDKVQYCKWYEYLKTILKKHESAE